VAPSGELRRLDTTASGPGSLPSSAIAKIPRVAETPQPIPNINVL
jgi:hypothetical protein